MTTFLMIWILQVNGTFWTSQGVYTDPYACAQEAARITTATRFAYCIRDNPLPPS